MNLEKTVQKTIVISGGSGTIGNAIIVKLIQSNYKIINIDLKKFHIQTNLTNIICDVTDYEKLCIELSKLNNLNNICGVITVAGGALPEEWGDFIKTNINIIKKSININLLGQINVVHACLPYLKENNNNKSITLISSINGYKSYSIAGYSAAKAGLQGFMYGISKELAKDNIRINMISPGTTVTELTLRETKKDWNKLKEDTITGIFVKPEDIAEVAYMLLNNNSIASQNIIIDSGQIAK